MASPHPHAGLHEKRGCGGDKIGNRSNGQCALSGVTFKKGKKNNQPRNPQASRLRPQHKMDGGWYIVYVDGSSKPLWKGSKYRAEGIGIYSEENTQSGKISISELLPPDLWQTNNEAEPGRKHIQQHRAGLQQGNSVLEP